MNLQIRFRCAAFRAHTAFKSFVALDQLEMPIEKPLSLESLSAVRRANKLFRVANFHMSQSLEQRVKYRVTVGASVLDFIENLRVFIFNVLHKETDLLVSLEESILKRALDRGRVEEEQVELYVVLGFSLAAVAANGPVGDWIRNYRCIFGLHEMILESRSAFNQVMIRFQRLSSVHIVVGLEICLVTVVKLADLALVGRKKGPNRVEAFVGALVHFYIF